MSTIRTFEKLLKMFNLMLLFFREKSVPKLGQSSLFWSPTRNENEQQILLTDSKRKQHLEYIGISEHVKLKNFKVVCSLCNNEIKYDSIFGYECDDCGTFVRIIEKIKTDKKLNEQG